MLKNLKFHDEIAAVQEEVNRLINGEGVNKIITLGHSGYDREQELAAAVEGVDLVIGGHSNTFLYTGKKQILEGPRSLNRKRETFKK